MINSKQLFSNLNLKFTQTKVLSCEINKQYFINSGFELETSAICLMTYLFVHPVIPLKKIAFQFRERITSGSISRAAFGEQVTHVVFRSISRKLNLLIRNS